MFTPVVNIYPIEASSASKCMPILAQCFNIYANFWWPLMGAQCFYTMASPSAWMLSLHFVTFPAIIEVSSLLSS
eukprot:jgi/Botrbrau1/13601/Bobra.0307s0020.1